MHFHLSHAPATARLGTLALAAALACAWPAAHAQSPAAAPVQTYDLPAQPLGSTLARIASQSGQQISVPADLVRGLQAPAVRGSLNAEQAARAALAGSGLELTRTERGNWSVRRMADATPAPSAAASAAAALPEVRVTAQADSAITEGTGSYTTRSTSAATGLGLSLRETPQSVTVITAQQLSDRGLSSVTQALENAPGLYKSNDFARPSFTARGFTVSNITVDGTPTQPGSRALSNLQSTSTVAYDSVTIVRGANGLLTGTGDPSASVNMVRKRATRDFRGHVNVAAGSWDTYGVEADVSGSLNAAGTLRGRIAAGGSDGNYFIDQKGQRSRALFATVEANLTRDTVARVGYHLDHSRLEGMSSESSVPLFHSDGSLTNLPRSWGDTPAAWSQKQNVRTTFVGLEHSFANGWQFDGLLTHSKHARTNPQVIKLASLDYYPNRDGSWPMEVYDYTPTPIRDRQWAYDLNLKGPLPLWGREHELLVRVNGWQRDRTQHEVDLADYTLPEGFLDGGLWSMSRFGFPVASREHPYPTARQRTEQFGGVLAARWHVADTLKLITGARVTTWKTRNNAYDSLTNAFSGTSGAYTVRNELTPYLGVTWDFHPQYTAYASYADVFTPQEYYDRNDNLLEPVVGKSYEVGIKGEFLDRRLNASAALFRSLQDNLAIRDSSFAMDYLTPGGNTPYLSAGKGNRAQGIDLEVSGALTDRWNITGGYVYTSLEDSEGHRLEPSKPEHVFRLFTTYRLEGALSRLTVGGGVNWHSGIKAAMDRPTGLFDADGSPITASQTIRQGGVPLVSAMARYDVSAQLSLSLNVDNLLDKKYFSDLSQWSPNGIYGTPRRVRVGMRYQF